MLPCCHVRVPPFCCCEPMLTSQLFSYSYHIFENDDLNGWWHDEAKTTWHDGQEGIMIWMDTVQTIPCDGKSWATNLQMSYNEFRLKVFFRRCLLSRSRITTNCRKRLWGSKRPPTWSWALWGSLLTQRLESYWYTVCLKYLKHEVSVFQMKVLASRGQKFLSNRL